jgi:hypothetical protein
VKTGCNLAEFSKEGCGEKILFASEDDDDDDDDKTVFVHL